jgi:hypothetical protein
VLLVQTDLDIVGEGCWSALRTQIRLRTKITNIRVQTLAPCSGLEAGWMCELGSSVSIVSGYSLDDWAIGVRFLAQAKGFFL